ncbi:MAG: hypothetical protein AAF408_07550, partial [Pseudomonadota bacterium]
MVGGFQDRGWIRFDADPELVAWVDHALPAARAAVRDPALAHWLDCEGTWFVGVDALDNDPQGRVGASAPLSGQAMDFITAHLGVLPLHKGQVSVTYPGYPRPRHGETEAAFGYRLRRDAAHVDGLKPVGPDRRRIIDEPHAWVLGLPLTHTSPEAAPMVVWEGSHKLVGAALADALNGHSPDDLNNVDVTDAYQAVRRRVFAECPRITVPARPGEAYVLHRHLLHGVAPWDENAAADPDGR